MAPKGAASDLAVVIRAGSLLQDSFLAFKETAFGRPVARVKELNGILYILVNGQQAPLRPGGHLFFLPDALKDDVERKRKILSCMACVDSLEFMRKTVKWLLQSVVSCCGIEHVTQVWVKNIAEHTRLVEPNKIHGEPDRTQHCLHRIRLRRENSYQVDEYALDLSGLQYGFKEVAMPWGEYVARRHDTQNRNAPSMKAVYEDDEVPFAHYDDASEWLYKMDLVEAFDRHMEAYKKSASPHLLLWTRRPDVLKREKKRVLDAVVQAAERASEDADEMAVQRKLEYALREAMETDMRDWLP